MKTQIFEVLSDGEEVTVEVETLRKQRAQFHLRAVDTELALDVAELPPPDQDLIYRRVFELRRAEAR